MWSKLENNRVMWQDKGRTEIYDELNLRKNMAGFLSNESRERYGEGKFLQYEDYYESLEWFMDGLKLFI